MTNLAIAIVNYHTEEFLRPCLESVLMSVQSISSEIYVVNNGSSKNEIDALKAELPGVNWIDPGENIGYSAANNLVMREARTRYVLLLNPDVIVPAGSLDRLMERCDANPEIGIAGCALVYPDGIIQQGPREGEIFSEDMALEQGGIIIDWPFVLGACMLIRRQAVEQCGVLDERIFMFHEDVEYCRRVREKGFRVCLFPDIYITHYGGASYSDLDWSIVERQKAVSFIIYCRNCLPPTR